MSASGAPQIVAYVFSGGLNNPPTTVSITPTAANQLIVVISTNTSLTSTSISSSPSLTWTQQYFVNNGSGYGLGSVFVVWYAISTSNSEVFITVSSDAIYTDVKAIVISGANNSSPFDTNSSFPAVATTSSGTSLTTIFSTSGTNELVIMGIGKNHAVDTFNFSTSFGTPTWLDGYSSSPEEAYAANTSSAQLSNATFTVSWSPNPNDSAGAITFAIVSSPTTPTSGFIQLSSSASAVGSTSSYLTYQVIYNGTQDLSNEVLSIEIVLGLHPRENSATIVFAGIIDIESARDITINRITNQTIQVFRGFSSNVTYSIDSTQGAVTNVQVSSYWGLLEQRILKIENMSPPPMAPNTNPWIIYLNPTLSLTFEQIFHEILYFGFSQSYSTGYLPPIVPGTVDPIFANAVVNDQMIVSYFTVAAAIDRLWQSALFNYQNPNTPWIAEIQLDTTQTWPTLNVKYYDPVHSAFGIGQNKSGINVGDGQAGSSVSTYSIIFQEGTNISSLSFQYDYQDMANSFVFTGGNFRGSQIVAVPLENPASIAQFGLKQQTKTLGNVIDTEEINRYIKGVIPLFQRPIPYITINITNQFIQQLTNNNQWVNPGDLVTLSTPSLVGVIRDMNGNVLSQANYVARTRQVKINWDADVNAENITYTFILPIVASTIHGEASQFLYSITSPQITTAIARFNQQVHDAQYNSETGPIENVSLTFSVKEMTKNNIPQIAYALVNIDAQTLNLQTQGTTTFTPQTALIQGLWITIYSDNPAVRSVYMRVIQPDGLCIYDSQTSVGYKIDLLASLIQANNSQGNLVNFLSGNYLFMISTNDGISAPQSSLINTITFVVETSYIKDINSQLRVLSAKKQAQNLIVQKGAQITRNLVFSK